MKQLDLLIGKGPLNWSLEPDWGISSDPRVIKCGTENKYRSSVSLSPRSEKRKLTGQSLYCKCLFIQGGVFHVLKLGKDMEVKNFIWQLGKGYVE